ncbi:MAG: AAA family ATPase [Hydrogenophilales bacterium]|nr:AAA family ATPase [Hydrogenophilales bacterium]
MLGQARAVDAVEFGLSIQREGYNLFVMGPPGMGKRSLVMNLLEAEAARGPIPSDWVYVHNFEQPHKPNAIKFPPGKALEFKDDMRHLIDDLLAAIPAVFASDDYHAQIEKIDNEFSEREEKAFNLLADEAQQSEIVLLRTPSGFTLAPAKKGEPVTPEEFEKLPDEEKTRITQVLETLQEQLEKLIRQAPQWRREKRNRVRALNREFSMIAVEHLINELKEKYQALPETIAYLEAVQADLIENADDFRKPQDGQTLLESPLGTPFRRYRVNVLVDHSTTQGAPVIVPDHPNYPNLVGRIEHMEHLGALVTDFSLIKHGALHQATGGYLVLDAHKLLTQPFAWDGLKRAMRAHQTRIDSLGQMLSLVSTVSLEPEPIPLDVKVVLLGERLLYYLLYEYDPEFRELFKVAADFEEEMPRSNENAQLYAQVIATLARKESLLPFQREACGRLIEQAARETGDAERLSAHMQDLQDLMREADYLARRDAQSAVPAAAVQAAIDARQRRAERLRLLMQEDILREIKRIDTTGSKVGQVNGLSVIEIGDTAFAHPTRLTATVRLGEGEVIDIEREIELGGAIHSKGVLTLSSFLATRYASNLPLSLSASLAFEQTYGMVEGDSASMAELCALLSAIADVPIIQSRAITGSVDQFGRMQAIGGVNEKIEGFFDICQARGLNGEQGVLIPRDNRKHLMLRADVVAACAEGKFHIWAVSDVDEAIELLTGLPAGEPDEEGAVPEGSMNYLVASRLLELSALRQMYRGKPAPPRRPKKRK